MTKQPVLILGATSAIARAAAQSFAEEGYPLFLAGRQVEELERIAADLHVHHQVEAKWGFFDAEDFNKHSSFLHGVVKEMDGMGGVLLAFGELGDQKKGTENFNEAERVILRNYTGTCSILTHCANYLELQGSGFIIGISSVAGDRGRQSNYIYGSAKGGLSLFLQGLRNRLYHAGVRVITIKPGFVDTAMTYGLQGMFLVASPDDIGKGIVRSLNRFRDVVYLPWFWRYIMGTIKLVPECLFKRLKL